MLLAEIATNAPAQSSLWFTVVMSVVASVLATAITLAVGLITLRKSEAYRRASRWEQGAEKLWDERIKLYSTIIEPFSKLTHEIRQSGNTPLPAEKGEHITNATAASLPLLLMASLSVSDAIGNVMESLIKYTDNGIHDLAAFEAEVQGRTFVLLNAMRDDLHLDHLDKHTLEAFS